MALSPVKNKKAAGAANEKEGQGQSKGPAADKPIEQKSHAPTHAAERAVEPPGAPRLPPPAGKPVGTATKTCGCCSMTHCVKQG